MFKYNAAMIAKMQKTQERNNRIVAEHATGMTFAAIGRKYGISRNQARMIVCRHNRKTSTQLRP